MRLIRTTLLWAALLAGTVPLAVSTGSAQAAEEAEAKQFHEEPPLLWTLLVNRLENRWRRGESSLAWDVKGWVGGDTNKIWFNAEGSKPYKKAVDEAEFQVLYSRMVSDFWDVQAGIRQDVRPQPRRTYGIIGLQGIAPYFFDINAQTFVSNKGDVSARLEVEYDLLITQRLILQPEFELNVAAQRVRELNVGRGFNDFELGARLRYEFTREFAPYIGVHWERKLGETANIARRHREDASSLSFVTGVRFWF